MPDEKFANIRNDFNLLLAAFVAPPYHRRIGASAHRRIGASAHRRIGASAHRRIGASAHRRIVILDSRAHRSPPPDSLTRGRGPVRTHGAMPPLIPGSGLDGLVYSSPLPVTRDVTFIGLGSDVISSHTGMSLTPKLYPFLFAQARLRILGAIQSRGASEK